MLRNTLAAAGLFAAQAAAMPSWFGGSGDLAERAAPKGYSGGSYGGVSSSKGTTVTTTSVLTTTVASQCPPAGYGGSTKTVTITCKAQLRRT
jgi:hypothetical protein